MDVSTTDVSTPGGAFVRAGVPSIPDGGGGGTQSIIRWVSKYKQIEATLLDFRYFTRNGISEFVG